MKAQLKAADRSGAPLALIIGEEERVAGSVTIRRLREAGEQVTVSIHDLLERAEETGILL